MSDQNRQQDADVTAQRIALVYAEALLNAADQRNQSDEILEELDSLVNDLFRAEPALESFLSSHAVGRDHKEAMLHRVFDGRASELLANFLQVLNRHERLDLIRGILQAYGDLRDQRARRMRVQVRSAVPLADDQRGRLVAQLRGSFQLEPILETAIEPELLGGMIVRVGDWLYDASVRTKLETIRKQLFERSSHEIQSGRDRFRTAE